MHVYDVYDNDLTEIHQPPKEAVSVFHELDLGFMQTETRHALAQAEEAFRSLELSTEEVINDLLNRTVWSGENCLNKKSLPFSRQSVEILRKYFVFLRFRNSAGYRQTVESLEQDYRGQEKDGSVYSAYRPLVVQHRLRYILRAFVKFLNHTSADGDTLRNKSEVPAVACSVDSFQEAMETYCWGLCEAELCMGLATEDQEFILSDRCYGTLDEGFEEDP